jgi:hypothetical protein
MSDLQLLLARNGVRIGLLHHCGRCTGPNDVAQHYGLRTTENGWHEIDRTMAKGILTELLMRDLAYACDADSAPIATDAAEEFMDEFSEATRFFTNSEWQHENARIKTGNSGFAATESTFDSGILALNDHKMGVYWVEDED